ncbi:hypothetical protein quinque_010456 [Culex quinquefasciatus]
MQHNTTQFIQLRLQKVHPKGQALLFTSCNSCSSERTTPGVFFPTSGVISRRTGTQYQWPPTVDLLQQLLNVPAQSYNRYIAWKNRDTGVFETLDPTGLAKLWDKQ